MINSRLFQSSTKSLLALLVLASISAHSIATELLMIEQPDCPYCERFNKEIGQIYGKTNEGKLAPLVRLQINEPWPEKYNEIAPAQFTPTFILVHEGQEVDRLPGYQGDEFFWFLLGELLEKLPQ